MRSAGAWVIPRGCGADSFSDPSAVPIPRDPRLADTTVVVAGVNIPSHGRPRDGQASRLVSVSSTLRNMRRLALSLACWSPILLSGPAGSGKSALLEEVAKMSGYQSDIVRLQLDDQIDSKTLLGTYTCTDVPGEFKWQPGALTHAVMKGRWVIIEDIDKAPFEVISAIITLLERRQLFLPGRGECVPAAAGFRIFATRTTGASFAPCQSSSLIDNLFSTVHCDPLSGSEIRTLLATLWPNLSFIVDDVLSVYSLFVHEDELAVYTPVQFPGMSRQVTLRDLFRWCNRLSLLFQNYESKFIPSSLRESMFSTAVDCFLAFFPQSELGQKLKAEKLSRMGQRLEVPSERIDYFLTSYRAVLQYSPADLSIGRVKLPRNSFMSDRLMKEASAFADTQYACNLMEQISTCVHFGEPCLLVGETGNGKTTVVQRLAQLAGKRLLVQNLNQQSDSSDFLGGYKPVELRSICVPIMNQFGALFPKSFNRAANAEFLSRLRTAFEQKKWPAVVQMFHQTLDMVRSKYSFDDLTTSSSSVLGAKRKKTDVQSGSRKEDLTTRNLIEQWKVLAGAIHRFERQVTHVSGAFAFWFAEGLLVTALREGHWVLLDEINLASSETLERLTGILDGDTGSLSLTERGDSESLYRHPDFRIFACMNPPTDVGKKDLPVSIRSKFSEFFVTDVENKHDVSVIVQQYLQEYRVSVPVDAIVDLYIQLRHEAKTSLVTGEDKRPLYSLRSLCRALSYCCKHAVLYSFERALYDGFCMSFSASLNAASRAHVEALFQHHLLGKKKFHLLDFVPKSPSADWVQIHQFWVRKGEHKSSIKSKYILTETVQNRLRDLARVVVSGNPVLLQGPTSAGKTSLVQYLAELTNHAFVRINNHEHTDLQEYMGSYVSDSTGRLVFQEGALVQAVRNGYWVVLDELNLAPSEVLEALNRLLDHNRELYIPETQETVHPHPDFVIFATQNPPGVYGGRKVLSRAFANRFVVLHYDDLPESELMTILEKSCVIPPSYCRCMIQVMNELQKRRERTQVFAGKGSLITPRDLFRWGHRKPQSYQQLAEDGYMLLGERLRTGAARQIVSEVLEKYCRVKLNMPDFYLKASSRTVDLAQQISQPQHELHNIAWTASLRRLAAIVERCIQNQEPVLLVGETGCGKTTVCQLLAAVLQQRLRIINCHQHSETSDFLGGLRPVRGKENREAELTSSLQTFFVTCAKARLVPDATQLALASLSEQMKHFQQIVARLKQQAKLLKQGGDSSNPGTKRRKIEVKESSSNAQEEISVVVSQEELDELRSLSQAVAQAWSRNQTLFEWHDGAVVQAMKQGDLLLIDEISLAEDAVLERLNSVLEAERTLLLAEKGGTPVEVIVGHPKFLILATMNPGGDFGKKELSPALRNRFTEIWVPSLDSDEDLLCIIKDHFVSAALHCLAPLILDFFRWLGAHTNVRCLSLRDILSWVSFLNTVAGISSEAHGKISLDEAYLHGACLVLLDGLGIGTGDSVVTTARLQARATEKLICQFPVERRSELSAKVFGLLDIKLAPACTADVFTRGIFGIAPFFIPTGTAPTPQVAYAMQAHTTNSNLLRVLRALQLPKAILLEGSPGVGKTSLITALASQSGHKLVRINLSEQTDIMDLLGSDLPVDGGKAGQFAWCDGLFLQALKAGHWVLLDELNLASQSVLEGLNAVLDHRAEVFIPELGKSFHCPPSFRIFACQNPVNEGGGRKGLPASFLNRFTKVHLKPMDQGDFLFICKTFYSHIPSEILQNMIMFNQRVHEDTMVNRIYGQVGSPWEFNLRDIFHWCDLITKAGVSHLLETPSLLTTISRNGSSSILHDPGTYVDLVYLQRMRTETDRHLLAQRFLELFPGTSLASGYDQSLNSVRLRVERNPPIEICPRVIQIGHSMLRRLDTQHLLDSNRNSLEFLHMHLRPLEHLMKCVEMNWPSILIGNSAVGKTSLVRLLAQITGNSLVEFLMTSSADSTELLGCFEQMDMSRHCQNLLSQVELSTNTISSKLVCTNNTDVALTMLQEIRQLWSLIKSRTSSQATAHLDSELFSLINTLLGTLTTICEQHPECLPSNSRLQPIIIAASARTLVSLNSDRERMIGTFEWVDGTLLRALEEGSWVLMENVNFCNPSVLDRLNPLLEENGVLIINECGLVNGLPRVVKPHPNFRLFLSMDPKFGEVSRAMRNRCIEIVIPASIGAVLPLNAQVDSSPRSSLDPGMRDLIVLVNANGISGGLIPRFMVLLHVEATELGQSFGLGHAALQALNVRLLIKWTHLARVQLQCGIDLRLSSILLESCLHTYSACFTSQASLAALTSMFHRLYKTIYEKIGSNSGELICNSVWPVRISQLPDISSPNYYMIQRQGVFLELFVNSCLSQIGYDCSSGEHSTEARIEMLAVPLRPRVLAASSPEMLAYAIGMLHVSDISPGLETVASLLSSGHNTSCLEALAMRIRAAAHFPNIPHANLVKELFRVGLFHFILVSSPVDWQLRCSWLLELKADLLNACTRVTSSGITLPLDYTYFTDLLELAVSVLQEMFSSSFYRRLSSRYNQLIQTFCLGDILSHRNLYLNNQPELTALLVVAAWRKDGLASNLASQGLQEYLNLSNRIPLMLEIWFRSNYEKQILSRLEEKLLGSSLCLSLIEQSFACHERKIGQQRVAHPFLAHIYRVLENISTAVQLCFDHDGVIFSAVAMSKRKTDTKLSWQFVTQHLIRARSLLWDCLHEMQGNAFDFSAISIRWKQVVKSFARFQACMDLSLAVELSSTLSHTSNGIDMLNSTLYQGFESHIFRIMWKSDGCNYLKRELALQEIQTHLSELDRSIRYQSDIKEEKSDAREHNSLGAPITSTEAQAAASKEVHPFHVVDLDWKRTLLEAQCSLDFLRQSNEDLKVNPMVPSLARAATALKTRLERRRSEATAAYQKAFFLVKVLSNEEDSLEQMGLGDVKTTTDFLDAPEQLDTLRVQTDFRNGASYQDTTLLPLFDVSSCKSLSDIFHRLQKLVHLCTVILLGKSSLTAHDMDRYVAQLRVQLISLRPLIAYAIGYGLEWTSQSPLSFAPLQTLGWLVDAMLQPPSETKNDTLSIDAKQMHQLSAILHRVSIQFNSLLWSCAVRQNNGLSGGPSVLNGALCTSTLLNFIRSSDQMPLSQRLGKISLIHNLIRALTYNEIEGKPNSSQSSSEFEENAELSAAFSCLCRLLTQLEKLFSPPDYSVIIHSSSILAFSLDTVTYKSPNPPDAHQQCSNLVDALLRCTDLIVREMVQRLLVPCFQDFTSLITRNSTVSLFQKKNIYASMWLRMGLFRLHSLLPSTSVDPVLKYEFQFADNCLWRDHLLCQKELVSWLEYIQHGAGESYRAPIAREIRQFLEHISERNAALSKKRVVRPAGAPPFRELFQELERFVKSSGDIAKVLALANTTADRSGSENRIKLFQENARLFISRVQDKFQEYPDIVSPVALAVYQIIYGLALISSLSTTTLQVGNIVTILNQLLSFPMGTVLTTQTGSVSSCETSLIFSALESLTEPSVMAAIGNLVNVRSSTDYGAVRAAEIRWKLLYSVLTRAAIFSYTSGRITQRIYRVLEQLLRASISVWSHQESAEKVKAAEEAKLYKYRHKTTEEQTEELLAELYPDYSEFFQEEATGISSLEDTAGIKPSQSSADENIEPASSGLQRLSSQHMAEIFDTFMQVFAVARKTQAAALDPVSSSAALEDLAKSRTEAYSMSYSAASDIMTSMQASSQLDLLPRGVDTASFVGHVFMASITSYRINPRLSQREQQSRLKKLPTSILRNDSEDCETQNVWKEANLNELMRIEAPLTRLMLRLRTLLTDYPKHPILIQLIRLCHKIASLPCDSPVMKILSGLELLLKKTEAWEAYAAKHVSIKKELVDLSILVARWRKMELHSWPYALAFRREACRENTIRWWFKLYGLIHVSAEEVDVFFRKDAAVAPPEAPEAQFSAYINELYRALDEFLQYSTVGEFQTRLDIINALRRQVSMELAGRFMSTDTRLPPATRAKIVSVLANVHDYYSQFLPHYFNHLKKTYDPIAKELKEQVQLAKWDLSNYYSLKESSERSHRKLLKFSSEYEEILRFPMRSILGELDLADTKDVRDDSIDFGSTPVIPSLPAVPELPEFAVDCRKKWEGWHVEPVVGAAEVNATQGATNKPLPVLFQSANSLLRKGFFAETFLNARLDAYDSIDEITSAFVQRVKTLKGKKLIYKKKALVDTLKQLKALGLSHLSSELQANTVDLAVLFQSSPLTAFGPWAESRGLQNLDSSAKASKITLAALEPLAGKSEKYTQILLAGMLRVRARVIKYHKDLSGSEVKRAQGYAEHFFSLVQHLRMNMAAAALEHQTLEQYATVFADAPVSQTLASKTLPHVDLQEWFWLQKDLIDACLETAQSHILLYSHLEGSRACADSIITRVSTASAALQRIVSALFTCKRSLDERMAVLFPERWLPNYNPGLWIACIHMQCCAFLQANFQALSQAMLCEDSLNLPLTSNGCWVALQQRVKSTLVRFQCECRVEIVAVENATTETLTLSLESGAGFGNIVSNLLLSIQGLYSLAAERHPQTASSADPTCVTEESASANLFDESADVDIADEFKRMSASLSALRLPTIIQAIGDFLRTPDVCSPQLLAKTACCRNLCPLLQQVLRQSRAVFYLCFQLLTSASELQRVLLAVLNSLLFKGFCRAPEEKEEENGKEEDNVEGTGMADGEGKEDVSKEIEDEEQVLGLKDDKTDKDQKQKPESEEKGDDKGIEMDGRFDGDMMDVPEEEEQEENEDKDDKEELDREMGDIDKDDKNIVDEKLWDQSDEEEQEKSKEEKFEKDAPVHGGGKDNELMANEDEEDDKKKEPPGEQKGTDTEEDSGPEEDGKEQKEKQGSESEEEQDDAPINTNDDDRFEENHEIEPMALPDDLKLDADDDEEKQAEDERQGDDSEGGEDVEDGDQLDKSPEEKNQDEKKPDTEEENDGMDESFPEIEKQDDPAADPNADPLDVPETTVELPEQLPDTKDRKDDAKAQRGSQAVDEGKGVEAENDRADQPQPDDQRDDPQAQQESAQSAEAERGARRERKPNDRPPQSKQSTKPESKEEKAANPYKSFADATKKWKERLNILEREEKKELSASDEAKQDSVQDPAEPEVELETVEKVGEREAAEAHALGANDETVEALPQPSEADREKEPEPDVAQPELDGKMHEPPPDEQMKPEEKKRDSKDRGGRQQLARPLPAQLEPSVDMDTEEPEAPEALDDEADVDVEDMDPRRTFAGPVAPESKGLDDQPRSELSREALLALREELRESIAAWDDQKLAHDLWSKLEVVTDELSQQLCEQLRTVLEPLLATRLKGDYRSGKRINIKKIIPYIASQFRKDKIWLRRTKPNKRNYQVMLAIDDSASMRANGAHAVALESLTMLSRALTRLEAGQLAVVKFGEAVKMLHPFEQPFTSEVKI